MVFTHSSLLNHKYAELSVTFLNTSRIVMHVHRYKTMSVLQEVKQIIFHSTFQEDQFPFKSSGSLFTRFTCFDIGMACIVRTGNHQVFKILYAYALDWKKTM